MCPFGSFCWISLRRSWSGSDFSYVEDVLSQEKALSMCARELTSRCLREHILKKGYPGYDTSVGWMDYDDEKVTN